MGDNFGLMMEVCLEFRVRIYLPDASHHPVQASITQPTPKAIEIRVFDIVSAPTRNLQTRRTVVGWYPLKEAQHESTYIHLLALPSSSQ